VIVDQPTVLTYISNWVFLEKAIGILGGIPYRKEGCWNTKKKLPATLGGIQNLGRIGAKIPASRVGNRV